jgi:hypothetical protein
LFSSRIKNSFEDWRRSKDAGWESSERNKRLAINKLTDALGKADYRAFQITQFSMQELVALQHVNNERKRVIKNLFQGKEVTLKAAHLQELIKTLFSVDTLDQLGSLAGTITSILAKAAVSVPPVVGQVKDGYDLFTGGGKPLRTGWRGRPEICD